MKENSPKQTSSGFTLSSVTGNDAGNYSKQVAAVHFNSHSHYTDIHRMATVFVKLHIATGLPTLKYKDISNIHIAN